MKLFSLALYLSFLVQVALSGTFTFQNNCPYTVWPATFSSTAQLLQTGFELPTGGSLNLYAPVGWSGRIWARTQCSTDASGRFSCLSADCGSGQVACNGAGNAPTATLAEFNLSRSADAKDYYQTSNVDGFNVPISITPVGGIGDIKLDCTTTTCAADINSICPNELQDKAADGTVVGCKSACEAFGSPEYCCKGGFSTPQTCRPTNYSRIFKTACPTTYSYPYDDTTSTFTCTGASYVITFCPYHLTGNFIFQNNCHYTVWPATISSTAQLSQTGFELPPGGSLNLNAPAGQGNGQIWARTQCSTDASGRFSCLSADCGSGQVACNGAKGAPPATLAEFSLNGFNNQDFYDISCVDGFNVPISITPVGGLGDITVDCTTTSCATDINSICPYELQDKAADGTVVGCKSTCLAFGSPEYCCTGSFATTQTCRPPGYSLIFKTACPTTYSYALDDVTSTFSCIGGSYVITFCP